MQAELGTSSLDGGLGMIDQKRLRELEEDFGVDDLAEIIDAFLEEAFESVDELRELDPETEREGIARRLHFLKGCARNIGAMALGDQCETLEARPADAVSPEVITKLTADLDAIRMWFRSACAI
jgi:HPt (histidine-containing phosphotransfer) domain-containing protein